jgi:hypothetical protein
MHKTESTHDHDQDDCVKALFGGILLGTLLLGLLRFAFAPLTPATHYHANWAVFVEGERLDLSADRFMEEVAACRSTDQGILPEERIHMHENDHDLVHVHHQGATWGALLANLGMGLGEGYLVLPDGRQLLVNDNERLVFVVNGLQVPDVYNRVVHSGDRMLISYTTDPQQAPTDEFASVRSDAEEYNERQDPAACAGHGELPFLERLRRAFWG